MTDPILLSVVLPTRNRQDVARVAIAALARIEDPSVEFIVQDGSDDTILGETLGPLRDDPRVRYFGDGPALLMADNWNRAMPRTRGEYVMYIGDDDGVDLNIMKLVRWAKRHDLDAACSSHWKFFWSDVHEPALAGKLLLQEPLTWRATIRDARTDAMDRLRRADLRTSYGLPKVYHGIVRRRTLDKIRATAGAYFASGSPDWFTTWALAPRIRRLGFVDFPFTVIGVCGASNSGRKMDPKRARDFFREYARVPFSSSSPRTELPSLMQHKLDAVSQGLAASGSPELIDLFNYPNWYAESIFESPPQLPALIGHFHRSLLGLSPLRRARQWKDLAGGLGQVVARRARRSVVARAERLLGRTSNRARGDAWRWARVGAAADILESLDVQSAVLARLGAVERLEEALAVELSE